MLEITALSITTFPQKEQCVLSDHMTTGDGKKISYSYCRVPERNLRTHLVLSAKLYWEAATTFCPDQDNVTTVYLQLRSRKSVFKSTIKKEIPSGD